MLTKRQLLYSGGGIAALATLGLAMRLGTDGAHSEDAAKGSFPLTKTEAEWRAALTPEQYRVLREEGTESPFSSALLDEHREGTFACAGCDQALFKSDTKFDSGTGWPSFFDEIKGNVAYSSDRTLGIMRTEEHCSRCGGHLGHVFDDGPPPTGKRHCINGLAIVFHPKDGATTG